MFLILTIAKLDYHPYTVIYSYFLGVAEAVYYAKTLLVVQNRHQLGY